MTPKALLPRVYAGIVTFNPDLEALSRLVAVLSDDPGKLVVIDNGSKNVADIGRLLLATGGAVELVRNGENRGVAAAVNQLAARAGAEGYRFVMPFDQDSLPVRGVQTLLVRLFEEARAAGRRPAAVGPVRIDPRTGEREPFVRFRLPFNERRTGLAGESAVACDFLITSGCLMSVDALEGVGTMEEALFVDNVDLEWSFRALSKGYCLLGAPRVPMLHRVGEDGVKLPWLRTAVRFHAPYRTYYVSRNRLRLYRRSYVPAAWKIQDVLRFVFKTMLLCTLTRERGDHFRFFLRGVRDSGRDKGVMAAGSTERGVP